MRHQQGRSCSAPNHQLLPASRRVPKPKYPGADADVPVTVRKVCKEGGSWSFGSSSESWCVGVNDSKAELEVTRT